MSDCPVIVDVSPVLEEDILGQDDRRVREHSGSPKIFRVPPGLYGTVLVCTLPSTAGQGKI